MAKYESCSTVTLESIDARCENSIGGIKRILIALKDEFPTSGLGLNADQLITGITGATQTAKFVEWKFRRGTGSYTSTLETDPAIGNNAVTTEVALQFTKAEATKRLYIQNTINANAVTIIEDMYGQYIFLGFDNPVIITGATMVSGTANADLNGFTLTFQDVAQQLPHFVAMTEAQINALLA